MIKARFAKNADPGGKEKSPTWVVATVLWRRENEPTGAILWTSEMVAWHRHDCIQIISQLFVPEHRAVWAYLTPDRRNHPTQRQSLLCTCTIVGRVRIRTLNKTNIPFLDILMQSQVKNYPLKGVWGSFCSSSKKVHHANCQVFFVIKVLLNLFLNFS